MDDTPLMHYVRKHDTSAVRRLLRSRADPNQHSGRAIGKRLYARPLYYAIKSPNDKALLLMELLLEAKANPHEPVYTEPRPPPWDRATTAWRLDDSTLHLAMSSKYNSMAKCLMLLEHGADPCLVGGRHADSVLEYAARTNNVPLVEIILERLLPHKNAGGKRCSQTIETLQVNHALRTALKCRHAGVVQTMLECGADANGFHYKNQRLEASTMRATWCICSHGNAPRSLRNTARTLVVLSATTPTVWATLPIELIEMIMAFV